MSNLKLLGVPDFHNLFILQRSLGVKLNSARMSDLSYQAGYLQTGICRLLRLFKSVHYIDVLFPLLLLVVHTPTR